MDVCRVGDEWTMCSKGGMDRWFVGVVVLGRHLEDGSCRDGVWRGQTMDVCHRLFEGSVGWTKGRKWRRMGLGWVQDSRWYLGAGSEGDVNNCLGDGGPDGRWKVGRMDWVFDGCETDDVGDVMKDWMAVGRRGGKDGLSV